MRSTSWPGSVSSFRFLIMCEVIFFVGVILVKSFDSVNEYAEALAVFKADVAKDGTGPVSVKLCSLIALMFSDESHREPFH